MKDSDRKRAARGPKKKRYWLDDRRNVDRLVYGLYTVCGLLFAIDIFVEKHGPFATDHVFGFYALYGFVGAFGLVLAAKQMRRIVMRREDYYDD